MPKPKSKPRYRYRVRIDEYKSDSDVAYIVEQRKLCVCCDNYFTLDVMSGFTSDDFPNGEGTYPTEEMPEIVMDFFTET